MSLKPQFRTHEPTGTTAADSSSNWRARRSEAPSPTTSPVSPRTPRPYGRVTERETGLPELHPLAPAIEDARRIYIGALQYFAARSDLETLLQPYNVEKIILSVDPFTSRNTGYCFVDFTSTEDATRAIAELNGKDLLGRAIKTNIATPKKNLTVTLRPPRGTTLAAEPSRRMVFDSWSRDDASEHFSAGNEGRRVRVNGLPSFSLHPPTVQAAMREFFSSFSVQAVSQIVPPESSGPQSHYLFVDFPTAAEAQRAIKELDGKEMWGVSVKLREARGASRKSKERDIVVGIADVTV